MPPPPPPPKVLISGLSPSTTSETVRNFFSRIGPVAHAILIRDEAGHPGGSAQVGFKGEESQQRAIVEMNGVEIDGYKISVSAYTNPVSAARQTGDASVFVGGLNTETTLEELRTHFVHLGELVHANIAQDAVTGTSRGYAKIVFATNAAKQRAINEMDKTELGGRCLTVRAFAMPTPAEVCSGLSKKANDDDAVFVGGLSLETSDAALREHFSSCGEIFQVLIAKDAATGRSRGMAKVVFASHAGKTAAIANLNGSQLDGSCLFVRQFTGVGFGMGPPPVTPGRATNGHAIFVARLGTAIGVEDLRRHFEVCGEVLHAAVFKDKATNKSKGYGKVVFTTASAVKTAISEYDSSMLHGQRISVRAYEFQRPCGTPLDESSAQSSSEGGTWVVRVSGIALDTSDKSLREHFAGCGEVTHAEVFTEDVAGMSMPAGHVAFSSQSAWRRALTEWHESELDGRILSVRKLEGPSRVVLSRLAKQPPTSSSTNIDDKARVRCSHTDPVVCVGQLSHPQVTARQPTDKVKTTCFASADLLKEERRRDPDDGVCYSFSEIFELLKSQGFSSCDAKEYWDFDMERLAIPDSFASHAPSGASNVVFDSRTSSNFFDDGSKKIDPDDGQVYTFDEFRVRHRGEISDEEIINCWRFDCIETSERLVATMPVYKARDHELRCVGAGTSEDFNKYWHHGTKVLKLGCMPTSGNECTTSWESSMPCSVVDSPPSERSPMAPAGLTARVSGPSRILASRCWNLSLRDWLLAVDDRLLSFLPTLEDHYDSVGQIIELYLLSGSKGYEFSEQFFSDMGINKIAHKRLVNRWVSKLDTLVQP